MADAFVGTWNLLTSENFDDYMKELGESLRLSLLNLFIFSFILGRVFGLRFVCACAHYRRHMDAVREGTRGISIHRSPPPLCVFSVVARCAGFFLFSIFCRKFHKVEVKRA